jgi:flagella basal body P-ring formation protein FlgA
MDRNLARIVLAIAALLPARAFCAKDAEPAGTPLLQIHLPREVTVQDGLLTLGQIGVIRGEASEAAVAGKIGLGQLSTPGQRTVLDRATILSRLASYGISGEKVRLTGADVVAVRRFSRTLSSDELIEVGRAFLRQHPPAPSIAEMIPSARPRDLVLSNDVEDLQVTPRFSRSRTRGYVGVQIVVTADGKEVGIRDILFRLKYRSRRVLAAREIAEGTVLTPEDLSIETVASDRPEPAGWAPPYGLVVLRKVPANAELRTDMLRAAQMPVAVRRNESVMIRIEQPGLTVTALGVALQEGRIGEYVKVRNTDSSRVIVCKVNPDGSVEPML